MAKQKKGAGPNGFYMEGTPLEMRIFDGPDAMHRVAIMNNIGINWTCSGDYEKDPNSYKESFEIIDTYRNYEASGLTRQDCEDYVYQEVYYGGQY